MRSVDRRLMCMINRTTICYLLDSEYFNQSELRWVNYESRNCIALTQNNRNSSWGLPFLYISTSIGILVSMSAYSIMFTPSLEGPLFLKFNSKMKWGDQLI